MYLDKEKLRAIQDLAGCTLMVTGGLCRTIDRRKRLLIAMDAAFGMEYLHNKSIVHFDLKCDNLLVNMRDPHRPICKVQIFSRSYQSCLDAGQNWAIGWKTLKAVVFKV